MPNNIRPFTIGEDALAAPRQVWLASLGAAAVTRDWVQSEATRTFRTLVKEGTAVESRAVAYVGDRIEQSMNQANRLWKQTRTTVEATVKQAADAAVTIANSALPKSLPRIELPQAAKPAPAKRAVRATRAKKSAHKAKGRGAKRTAQ
jgi:hypothetical protein